MTTIVLAALAIISAVVWLVILVATGFSSYAVGAGLLGALVANGALSRRARSV